MLALSRATQARSRVAQRRKIQSLSRRSAILCRVIHRLGVRWIAQAAGISPETVRGWLKGSDPKPETLAKVIAVAPQYEGELLRQVAGPRRVLARRHTCRVLKQDVITALDERCPRCRSEGRRCFVWVY